MLFKVIFLIIIVFDIFLNVTICKKDIPSFKNNLPYNIETFVLIFLFPSIMMNYYLINDCYQEEALNMSLICLVCSCILNLFYSDKLSKNMKNIFLTIAVNILYIYIVAFDLYSRIEYTRILNIAFIVLTILLTFLVYISIIDTLIKNIVCCILLKGVEYFKIITVLFYVLAVLFATNISAFRYYDNLISILLPSTSVSINANQEGNSSIDNSYTPNVKSVDTIIGIDENLTPLNSDITDDLQHDYRDYRVGSGVNWYLDGTSYEDIELLQYLEVICESDAYNPFRLTRQIFNNCLDVKVSPDNFSDTATFDNSNNLNIDYTQYEGQSVDNYIKIVYNQIMSEFCSKDIDLSQIYIDKEDNQKYIFTVYFNDITQTYDIFCLYFNFDDDDKFQGIHYDVVSISRTPIKVYSNYVDILPINQTDEATERYKSYNINNEYYVIFKYYS